MNKKNFYYIIGLVTCCLLIIFLFINYQSVFAFIGNVMRILRPVVIGFIFAFILNKPYKLLLKLMYKSKIISKYKRTTNIIAIILVYIFLAAILSGIIWIIIPQFINSFNMFSDNINTYVGSFTHATQNFYSKVNNMLPEKINLLDKFYKALENLPQIFKTLVFGAFDLTSSIINTLIDIFFGLIISVYFLIGKDKLTIQCKRFVYAFFNKQNSDKIVHALRYTGETFSNFVTGQIIESFILGSLCCLGLTLLRLDYAFLIGVLVGVTSLIPVVGAFIGTIPSVLILMLVDYKQAIIFVIFIIVLQQIEGNLIYPRVVGTKVGLPALWVLLAIIIGGGVGGVLGMLVAVPVMSMIYDLTRKNVNRRLNEKNINIK